MVQRNAFCKSKPGLVSRKRTVQTLQFEIEDTYFESLLYSKSKCNVIASTMKAVRSSFWIPVLRNLTKSAILNCYGYKRLRETHYPNRKPGLLPKNRTE